MATKEVAKPETNAANQEPPKDAPVDSTPPQEASKEAEPKSDAGESKSEATTPETNSKDTKESVESETKPDPTPKATKASDTPTTPKPAEKKSLFSRFKRKKKDDKVTDKNDDSTTILSKELYQQIAENSDSEYWTLKFRKKTTLVVIGILIILLWLSSLARIWWQQRETTPKTEIETEMPSEVTPESEGFKIRVRYNREENASAAAKLADFLLSQPEVSFTDTAKDLESEYEGVSLVTKSGDTETRRQILILVESQYSTGTIAAQLTEDSNIDASVLFNPPIIQE